MSEEQIDPQMTVNFTIFDPVTGRIDRTGFCVFADVELQKRQGEGLILGSADDVTQYVLDDVITDRPAFSISKTQIAADDVDEAVMHGLPDPVVVKIDDVEHEVAGGSISISSPMPATYRIEIDHWPYLPFNAEIVAS
ncbi:MULTISPECIES: hypothetical protein [unclassified Ensifer]|uniref:hypothetical protein n=1 Tax=unclassified Ensifer TaxID=2633371 RepID=UPI000813ACDD|nr:MULTISPECIES: hypothetical protein [unclassified Ensifer]OCP21889.1 hypothetical protein BC361_25305 [Ensifer sp. LC54]OCP23331.1 hypothetical protein BC363_25460 [Ensifer sp. LC384]